MKTGGQVTGIENVNILRTYIRNILRNEKTSQTIYNSINKTDANLALIWKKKSSKYFSDLQSLNEFILSSLDFTKYYETVHKLKPVFHSYANLRAFVEVLMDEYDNAHQTELISRLKSFLRWLVRTETLEVIPQNAPLKMIDTNGLEITYSGSVCIYQLCLPTLKNVQISAPYNKDFLVVKANLTQYQPSNRLEFTVNDTLEMTIHKHTFTFTAKLTGQVKLLEHSYPIDITLNEKRYLYTSLVQMEGFSSSSSFKISKSGRIFSVGWQDMVDSIVGETLQTKPLTDRALKNMERISNRTEERLDLIQRRKRDSQMKYQRTWDATDSARKQAEKTGVEHDRTNAVYKSKLLQMKGQQERYSLCCYKMIYFNRYENGKLACYS